MKVSKRKAGRVWGLAGILVILAAVVLIAAGGGLTGDKRAAAEKKNRSIFGGISSMIRVIDYSREKSSVSKNIEEAVEETEVMQPSVEEGYRQQAMELLTAMTLEDKVSQMFFITPEALTGGENVTETGEAMLSALQSYPVGGIVYFASNLVTPDQTRRMLTTIQDYMSEAHGIPVFLGVDEEGGRVLRIGNNNNFDVERIAAMGTLAQEGEAGVIEAAGNTIGAYLSDLGFNVDFAPDADVLTNTENQVIGDRSFGTDPDKVADMAWAFCRGLHANGVLSAYKHFPGHGETSEDSHSGYAFSYETLEELKSAELIPFQSGSDNGVDFIMAGHISVPNVTGNDIPATMSKMLVTDLLRTDMGYTGIIITDALNMGAITEHYTSGEAAVTAVQAGCDMLLMPENFKEAREAVLNAVSEGRISEERIEESVLRILQAKLKLAAGLNVLQ